MLVEVMGQSFGFSYGDGSKPCTPGEHQNSSKMDVHPLKMVFIGIDPWPYGYVYIYIYGSYGTRSYSW
jgi:hypothetical protein